MTDPRGTGVLPSKKRRPSSSCSAAPEPPDSQDCASQEHDQCYPALLGVSGQVHLTSTLGTLQPDESVGLLALGSQYLAQAFSAFKLGDCTSDTRGCRGPWNVPFDAMTHRDKGGQILLTGCPLMMCACWRVGAHPTWVTSGRLGRGQREA